MNLFGGTIINQSNWINQKTASLIFSEIPTPPDVEQAIQLESLDGFFLLESGTGIGVIGLEEGS